MRIGHDDISVGLFWAIRSLEPQGKRTSTKAHKGLQSDAKNIRWWRGTTRPLDLDPKKGKPEIQVPGTMRNLQKKRVQN